jgi:parallel beta-helix repeat protein
MGNIKRQKVRLMASMFLLVVMSMVSATVGKTIYVDDDGPADFNNIQAAIDAVLDRDTVLVAPGEYVVYEAVTYRGKNITLKSGAGPETTIIRAQGSDYVITFINGENQDAILQGFTITGANRFGIWCSSASPVIKENIITRNRSGMYLGSTTALIIRNIIFDNAGEDFGGGIACDVGTPEITQNVIYSNRATRSGGGICCYDGSTAIIKNNLIYDNEATDSGIGGGFYTEMEDLPVFVGNTVVGNRAERGGGVRIANKGIIKNCIIWGNVASSQDNDIYIQVVESPNILYCDISDSPFCGQNGNICEDPMFVDPENNDYHLRPDSPCIDAGDPNFVPVLGETDIDVEPRVMGIRVDIGADEFTSTPIPIIGISPTAFAFHADETGPNPEKQVLFIHNAGSGNLIWNVTHDASWLEIDPCNGESTGEINAVNLAIDISGLGPGQYTCELTITADGASNSPQTVSVTVYIRPVDGELDVPSEYVTIQSAMNTAQNGDTVILAEGTYTGDGNRKLDFKGKSISVRSADPGNPAVVAATVIDCEGHGCGFNFHSSEGPHSVLAGLTITNGDCGGICITDSSPLISYCTISNNLSRIFGGGISCQNASPIITHCTIADNSVTDSGGGIFCYYFSNPIIKHCKITGNVAGSSGGGIDCRILSSPTITNCIFSDNSAGNGGGMCNFRSNIELTNCAFTANSASSGAGMYNGASSLTLNNCTFSGNLASEGGGMYSASSSSMLTNCTFVANSADNGRTLACDSFAHWYPSNLQLTNCILWDGGSEIQNYDNSTIAIAYSDVQGGCLGEGNINIDPCFADPGYWEDPCNTPTYPWDDVLIGGDYHLKSQAGRWDVNEGGWTKDDVTSPCIDAGDPNSPIGFETFPNGGIINMGAFGGTAEASKSYFGEPPCETIIAGDINGDCIVNLKDFAIMTYHWLEEH